MARTMKSVSAHREMRTVLRVTGLLGLSPFLDDLKPSPLLSLYSVAVFLVLTATSVMVYVVYVPRVWLMSVLDAVQILVMNTAFGWAVICGAFKHNDFVEFIGCLDSADRLTASLGHPYPCGGGDVGVIRLVIGGVTVLGMFLLHIIIFNMIDSIYYCLWSGVLYLNLLLIITIQVKWSSCVSLLCGRLSFLCSSVDLRHPPASLAFSKICSASESLDRFSSGQILVCVSSIFVTSTLTFYLLLRWAVASHDNGGFLPGIIINSLWAAVCLGQMVHLAKFATQAKKKAEEFQDELYRTLISSTIEDVETLEKLRLTLVMNEKIHLSAANFFQLDYSIITMIAGATSIYLVILIQYDINCSCKD